MQKSGQTCSGEIWVRYGRILKKSWSRSTIFMKNNFENCCGRNVSLCIHEYLTLYLLSEKEN
jgi:hypothetical protein